MANQQPVRDEQPGESLEQVKQRFALWRAGRKRGAHVTDALWAAAVTLATRHGLTLVAQQLGLHPGRLKKRIECGVVPVPAAQGKRAVQFVELFVSFR